MMDNMVFGICSQKLRKVGVDKSQLISIIDYWDLSSGEYPPENYTPESYQAVLDAYVIAVDVRDNGEATQEEVDDAYLDLLNAISELEEVGGGSCTYPLDKTDFSDIPIPVVAAEPLDSSFQKFRVKAGLPNDRQIAAPDGFELEGGTDRYNLTFPNRGTLGDSFIYALKIRATGAPRTAELGIPQLYFYVPEVYWWLPINMVSIEPSPDSEAWSVRLGLINSVRYTLPEEFTLVIFSGEEIGGDAPIYTYIPELGVCDLSGISLNELEFGFVLLGESQNEDYDVELITDKETIVNLIGDFDIPAATSATLIGEEVTEVKTICGEVIDLTPTESDSCDYPLDKTDFSDIEATTGIPEGSISRPESLDSSQQYFKITDGFLNVLAPKELVMDSYGIEVTSPIVSSISAGFSFGIEIDFSEKVEGATPENLIAVLLPYKDGNPLLTGAEFNQNFAGIAGSRFYPQSDKYTVVAVVTSDGFFSCAFESDESLIGSDYRVSPVGIIEEYDDFGIMFQMMMYDETMNPGGSVFEGTKIRLITGKEELSDLFNKVDYSEVTDTITTLCGQPLDLNPIEPQGCVYPLDKTDWSEIPLPIAVPEALDSTFQKFRFPSDGPQGTLLIAAPEGTDLDLTLGKVVLPERGTTTNLATFAVKVSMGEVWSVQPVSIPMVFWLEEDSAESDVIINSYQSELSLATVDGAVALPNEFTLVVSLGSAVDGEIPIHCIVPELGNEVHLIDNITGISSLEGFYYGLAIQGGAQTDDFFVELVTDAEGISELLGSYSFGYTAKTLCGQPINLNPVEPEDCVYPFDVTPAELATIGYNPYPIHDECYNKFSWDGSGTGNYAATKKEAFEFFVSGIVPDSAKIPLPNSSGTAIEYRIKFPSDDNESSFPILNALVFGIPSGGVHSGGGFLLQQNTAANRRLSVLGQGDTVGNAISVPQEISEITVSVLYKSDGTMDVRSAYGEVLGKPYLLDSFLALTSAGSTEGEFEVITRAEDLTFTYPPGTVGLDGEPVIFQQ